MGAPVGGDDDDIISGINITPFVDVVLVILIIFLVTATYVTARTKAIPMDLPKAKTGEDVAATLAISLDADGILYLDGRRTDEESLLAKLPGIRAENPDVRAIIAADGKVEYREVMRLMDLIRRAGISRLAFNIKIDDGRPARAGAP
jgi:biopolymer transport protein ExbD